MGYILRGRIPSIVPMGEPESISAMAHLRIVDVSIPYFNAKAARAKI